MVVFSPEWIREKAKEILGHNNISIFKECPGEVKIIVYNSRRCKFNEFKKMILAEMPIGCIVSVERREQKTNLVINTLKNKISLNDVDITDSVKEISIKAEDKKTTIVVLSVPTENVDIK